MSGVVAVVPTRGLRNGKTRLAGLFSPEARTLLTERMLRSVVGAALASEVIDAVAVISPDRAALDLARTIDDRVVALPQDVDGPGLNAAAAVGRSWALGRRVGALLVLFGDLPLLCPDDVARLVALPAPVVLAPDRHETGTNALLLRFVVANGAAERFAFQFGTGSAGRHVAEARRLDLPYATFSTTGTALDLDTPEDWLAVLTHANGASGRGCGADAILASVGDAGAVTEGDRR